MPISDLFGLLQKRQTTPDKYLASSVNIVSGGQHGAQRAPFSPVSGVRAFRSWVYAAASINANAVAALPLRLYAKKDATPLPTRSIPRGRKAYMMGDLSGDARPSASVMRKAVAYGDDFEEVTGSHPITDLLARANPFLNGFDLSVLRILYGELTGNAYLHPIIDEASGLPAEIWPLAPHYVEVIPDDDEFIRGYVYGVDSQHKQIFEPDEVIHFRRPNPGNYFYGLGKVEAAWGVIQANEAVHEMDLATFANQARPDYAVVVKGNPTGDQLDRFQQQVENKLRGTRKNGSFLAMSGDVQFTPLNFPPKDLAGREEIVEEIAAVFGVPVSMLKANDPNLASAQTGFAQWREGTILPLCRMDEEELNQSLLPMFGLEDTHCLAYDNPVPADKAYELQERQTAVAGGWRTPNEARIEEGREPISDEFANRLLVGGQPIGGQVGSVGFGIGGGLFDSPEPETPSTPTQPVETPTAAPLAALNGAQIQSVVTVLDGVAGGNITPIAAIELIVATGLGRTEAERMVNSQEDAKPAAAVEAEIETDDTPAKAAIKLLAFYGSGRISEYATIKLMQSAGFARKSAERMIAAQPAAKRDKIHRMPDEPFDDCVERGIEVVMAEGYDREQAVAMAYSMCEGSKAAGEDKAIADVDLEPTEEMAALAERGLKLREEYGRGGTEVGVARARDIKNRSNLSPETVGRMANFFGRHRVDLDAPAADPGHEDYPSAGVIAWLLWGGDPADPDGAGAAWAERKMDELERAEEKGEAEHEEKACGCCDPVTKAAKVYEWPEEVKWYRLAIEGLEDDYERLRPKAAEDEPTADEDIREGEKRTPAMAIRAIVEDGLQQVQKRLVRALESGEIAPVPQKADGRRDALRKILADLAGVKGKMLDDLLAAFEQAARGGGSVGASRVNEILAGVGAGRISTPDLSAKLVEALNKRATLIARSVIDETVRAFDSGLGQTFSIEKEVDRLRSAYGYSKDRATVIARTESANAYHEGQIDAWKESGVVREKHFLKAAGACEFCEAVDRKFGRGAEALPIDAPMVRAGQVIKGTGGGSFKVGLSSKGIVHPNCRCDFIPVLEDFG
jgi:HK97 family phage portal protein